MPQFELVGGHRRRRPARASVSDEEAYHADVTGKLRAGTAVTDVDRFESDLLAGVRGHSETSGHGAIRKIQCETVVMAVPSRDGRKVAWALLTSVECLLSHSSIAAGPGLGRTPGLWGGEE